MFESCWAHQPSPTYAISVGYGWQAKPRFRHNLEHDASST